MEYPLNYTADKLVERAVRNANPSESGKHPRWVAVMDTFATGATVAMELCRLFNLDPHEELSGPHCISCNP